MAVECGLCPHEIVGAIILYVMTLMLLRQHSPLNEDRHGSAQIPKPSLINCMT